MFISMETIIAFIWMLAVVYLKKSIDVKYHRVNLDTIKFLVHSFVFTLSIFGYLI